MTTAQDGPIELVLPGHSRYLRLARLTASGVVSVHRLAVSSVEDVRVAVDELCAALIEAGQGEPLTLRFAGRPDALVVRGTVRLSAHAPTDEKRLAIRRRLLDVLASAHDYRHRDGQAVFTVTIPLEPAGAPLAGRRPS